MSIEEENLNADSDNAVLNLPPHNDFDCDIVCAGNSNNLAKDLNLRKVVIHKYTKKNLTDKSGFLKH